MDVHTFTCLPICVQLDYATLIQFKTFCVGDGAIHSGLGLPLIN